MSDLLTLITFAAVWLSAAPAFLLFLPTVVNHNVLNIFRKCVCVQFTVSEHTQQLFVRGPVENTH